MTKETVDINILVTFRYGDKKNMQPVIIQGLIQAAFNVVILISGTLIWASINTILSQIKTIKKCNSRFLIMLIT